MQSAKDHPLQKDGVAEVSEADRDAVEAKVWLFFYRHHGMPRAKLYVPKEPSFPIWTIGKSVLSMSHGTFDGHGILSEKLE